jgi:hypothetical protein
MTNQEFIKTAKRTADLNLQLIETIADLANDNRITISEELAEMLNFCLDINFQLFRLSNEKIIENVNVL